MLVIWATITHNRSPYATGLLSCLSVTLVYCGQTDEWIKMPLGTEIGLGPGNIVRWGPSSPRGKEHSNPPLFGPRLLWPNGGQSQQLLISKHYFQKQINK